MELGAMWLSRVFVLLLIVAGFVLLCLGILLLIRRLFPSIKDVTTPGELNFEKAFTFVSLAWSLLFFVLVLTGLGNFTDYRQAAHAEVTDLASAWQDAETFPASIRDPLQREIVCYAYFAETKEWQEEADEPSVGANQALARMRSHIVEYPIDQWNALAFSGAFVDELESLEDNRGQRLSHAGALLTPPLWVIYSVVTLLLLAVAVFIPTRGDGGLRHGVFIGCVALAIAAVTAGLAYLDRPGDAGLDWTAMRVFDERISGAQPAVTDCPGS